MDNEQVAWLNLVLKQVREANGGKRKKLVLFSHQQLFSRLEGQGTKLHNALLHLLESQAVTAWYWGHEHNCVIYDPHPRFGLLGRCLGNGGIPSVRKDLVKEAASEKIVGERLVEASGQDRATAQPVSCSTDRTRTSRERRRSSCPTAT